jgi:hypothetical protein
VEEGANCMTYSRLESQPMRVKGGIKEYDTKVTFPRCLVRYEMGKLNGANDKW